MQPRHKKSPGSQNFGGKRRHIFVAVVLLFGVLPTLLEVLSGGDKMSSAPLKASIPIPLVGEQLTAGINWVRANDGSVEEFRPLAAFPSAWTGKWYDLNKNYAKFEKWFSDNLAMRSLMIRFKNEIDYSLFKTSTRVYYGKGNDIYGRGLIDNDLPSTERVLGTQHNMEAVVSGVLQLTTTLRNEGIEPVWVVPMMKEYFYPDRLPWYASHLKFPTRFQTFYKRLKSDNRLNFIDVYGILAREKSQYPIFYKQDFHWTDLSAALVSRETVQKIAELSDSPTQWNHPITVSNESYVGSDSRFSARFSGDESIVEPMLRKTWTDKHLTTTFSAAQTAKSGIEFETNELKDNGLIPSTCMYGNSFGDGMLRSGLPDYFQKFTKLDRNLPLLEIPKIARGRCKFIVIQVLDIQPYRWIEFLQ